MNNIKLPDEKITTLIFAALEDGWEVKQIKNTNNKNHITINNKMYEFTKQNNKIKNNENFLKYFQKIVNKCKHTT
tara:strand:- start:1594 stop:1818 length:225 start_codon:yes stop_codon:yes gene_type:complete